MAQTENLRYETSFRQSMAILLIFGLFGFVDSLVFGLSLLCHAFIHLNSQLVYKGRVVWRSNCFINLYVPGTAV